tara:strand:+ start:688 stop:1362 length:675 start_codon:yes stop_codon:yes gene_type:complete
LIIRSIDIIFSGVALVILTPLFLIIILILRFSGEGEIFYIQERIGLNNSTFGLIKFTTMLKDSEKIGTITFKNDPRILPLGAFLRKSKINELPQLINIFIGDMSLIGPRPQTKNCFNKYLLRDQIIISNLKPGLSGIGSIIFRNEEEMLDNNKLNIDYYDEVLSPYKGSVESWYSGIESIRMYFMIIFLTIWVVLFPSSQIVWKTFKTIPAPPEELKIKLNYPN